MTHLEAYNILKTRIEWQKPLDTVFSFLEFGVPESGRFLQEEHSAVRIPIIKETLFDLDIDNSDYPDALEGLKKKAILQMLHDVFHDQKEVCDNWINDNIGLFDYSIILKNTTSIISDVLSSTRLNDTTIVLEDNLKRWYIDLNGLNDKENGVYQQGFISRYRQEINRIRKVLFLRKSLTVITAR